MFIRTLAALQAQGCAASTRDEHAVILTGLFLPHKIGSSSTRASFAGCNCYAFAGQKVYLLLSLPQDLLFVPEKRRKQIAQHRARTGLDLRGDCHAKAEIDKLVLDLHLGAIKRNARGVG